MRLPDDFMSTVTFGRICPCGKCGKVKICTRLHPGEDTNLFLCFACAPKPEPDVEVQTP